MGDGKALNEPQTTQQPALRFLFVTADRFPPFRPDVEILFGKEFLRRGHDIDWILQAGDADGPSGALRWRGFRAWVAPTNPGKTRAERVHKHLLSLCNDIRAVGLLRRRRYDFVQVKDKFLAALIFLLAAKLKRLPYFFWLSFPYPEASLLEAKAPGARYPFFYLVRGWLFKAILYGIVCRYADHVFVQSDAMKRAMAKQGVAEGKMTAVPMGVDMEMFPSRNDPSDEPGDELWIVYLGSLGRARRLEFLLDAFATVVKALPKARLMLIGEGDEPEDRPRLEDYTAQAGLTDRVVFTGFLSREHAMQHVQRAAVGVSPIRPTPMYDVASPTKILEYMAAGRPVVANDQPDQKQVLEDSRAGICTPYEVGAFAGALIEILGNRDAARSMGQRGRRYVSAHRSYTVLAGSVEQRYRELLAGSAA